MNDASRELGAALGIAVMWSIAASQFTNRVDSLTRGLSPALQERASASIAGAISVADSIGGKAGAVLHAGANGAFLDGIPEQTVLGIGLASGEGVGISLLVVFVAALNLVLDFDFIEKGAEQGAPKYMEWYGAFGLLVTLVWLYLEILRLLSYFQSD